MFCYIDWFFTAYLLTLEVAVADTAVTVSELRISSAIFTATFEGFKLTSPIV